MSGNGSEWPKSSGWTKEQTIRSAYAGVRKRRRGRRAEEAVLEELDAFCTELTKRPDLKPDQKDFLLSCLEEGCPVPLISKIMVSTLSVDQMKRFIKVYEKRMGGRTR